MAERADDPSTRQDACFFGIPAAMGPADGGLSLHVAFAGGDERVLFEGFRHYPATHVVILHARDELRRARRARETFRRAGIATRLHQTEDAPYFGALRALNTVASESRLAYDTILVNVSSGTPATGCAATTGAFLHGLKAFAVQGDEACLLPVLPASQRALLSDAQVALLLALAGAPTTRAALARRTSLASDAVHAHLDGEPGRKGLLGLGLVERVRRFGLWEAVQLSPTGESLLASGAVTSRSPTV